MVKGIKMKISEFENAWKESKITIKDIRLNNFTTHIFADYYHIEKDGCGLRDDLGFIHLFRKTEYVARVRSENVISVMGVN